VKIAVDTNVLAYAEGINDAERQLIAQLLLQQLPEESVLIPVQALGELYNVLTRKTAWPGDRILSAIAVWRDGYNLAATTKTAMVAAIDLAAEHKLNVWDGVIMSVAAENDCRLLLSEDLQDGFSWRGLTVANPFAAVRHPLLEALLNGTSDI
jgi:predicted nucleic acid-binding protein